MKYIRAWLIVAALVLAVPTFILGMYRPELAFFHSIPLSILVLCAIEVLEDEVRRLSHESI